MPRKILVLRGSPRKNGNSAALAEQAVQGAREAGASIEEALLDRMSIRPCNACDMCRTKGQCVIQDDMQTLYPKLQEADAIVIASPIYYFTMSAQVKLCIDRWYALETPQGNALRGKQIGLLLAYGDSDLYTSGGINAIHTFESIFRYIGCEIAGMVYGTAGAAGEMQQQTELMQKAYQLGRKLGTEPKPTQL